MHKLLRRQLKLHLGTTEVPEPLARLLEAVDAAYTASDEDRALLQRALDLTSQEMLGRYQRLVESQKRELRIEARLRAAEGRFRQILEHSQILTVMLSPTGAITFTNAAFRKLTDYGEPELLGRPLDAFLVPPEQGTSFAEWLHRQEPERPIEVELVCRDGARRHISWNLSVLQAEDHTVDALAVIGSDVTERRRAEEALRASQERYALVVKAAYDGIWDWDRATQTIYVSERWLEMIGLDPQQTTTSYAAWAQRVPPEDLAPAEAAVQRHLRGETPCFEYEFRVRHEDGSYRWVLMRGMAIRNAAGKVTRMAGSVTDITERKQAEARLRHDALHDTLTGLSNRAFFLATLQQSLSRLHRHPQRHFAVLFLDLDRFKLVNDSLGHITGDRMLVLIAQRLQQNVRPSDIVSRFGGDEFAVYLDSLNAPSDAIEAAERILQALNQPVVLNGEELFVSASIGVAMSQPDYLTPDELLRDADTALYRAKALGRGRVALFEPSMRREAVALLQLESDLRRALERGELDVHYQPIVDVETSRTVGVEALLRWHHPQRGEITPAQFIPVAEESSFIIQLGQWVLRESCRQFQAWRQRWSLPDSLTVSVNVSARQLAQADFVEQVEQILRETGLPGRCLRLELTETMLMAHPERTSRILERLHRSGVRVLMDDFGTGYSSLSYLHRFEFDVIKIDRSFVHALEARGHHHELLSTMVTLARNLGKTVVAEGVETPQQLALLQAMKCRYAQGFLYAKALPATEAEVWLAQGSSYAAPSVRISGNAPARETAIEQAAG